MSGSAAPGRPAPEALRCVGCARGFGSVVAFCPFCGVAQRPAVPLRPVAEPSAKPALRAGLEPTPSPAPKMVVPDAAAIVQPPPVPPVPAGPASDVPPGRARPPPRKRSRWVLWIAIGGLIVLATQLMVLRPPAAAKASLLVRVATANGTAVQGGQVLVDNQVVGAPGQVLSVPPGSVTVSYVNPGWHSERKGVTLAANASLAVFLKAWQSPSHVTLTTTPPGATVTFGGRSYGRTPFAADMEPGSYDIAVALNGYVTKIVALTLARGEPAVITLDLTAAPVRRTEAPFDRGVMTKAAQLLAAPAWNADVVAMLFAGSEVQVQSRVASDAAWLQVRAAGRAGYIPAEGTVEPWDSWAQRNAVSGPLETVTPDLRVLIGGRSYPLAGVQAPGQGIATTNAILQADSALLTALHGTAVRCVPHDMASFECRNTAGQDVGELYLRYGAASAAAGALPAYAEAQRGAREEQRGMWAP